MSCIAVVSVPECDYPPQVLFDVFDRARELEYECDHELPRYVAVNPDCLLRGDWRTGVALDEEEQPVGFLHYWMRANNSDVLVRLERVYVLPNARGAGVGTEMVDWCAHAVARELGVRPKKVVLVSEIVSQGGAATHRALQVRLAEVLAEQFKGLVPVLGEVEGVAAAA